MPTIPETRLPQVMLSARPVQQFDTSVAQGGQIAAQQAQQTGQALQQAGGAALSIYEKEMQRANTNRVNEAVNSGMDWMLRYQYDKDEGYLNLKGKNALERPDGKSLVDEYDEKLNGRLNEIETGLANDTQRQMFRQQAVQLRQRMRQNASVHLSRENDVWEEGVHTGITKTATDAAVLGWGDPNNVSENTDRIKASTFDYYANKKGLPAAEVQAKLQESVTPAHLGVITSAVQAGNSQYAKQYFDRVQQELTPTALIQGRKMVEEATKLSTAVGDVDSALSAIGFGEKPGEAIDPYKADKYLRDQFAGDPDRLKAARAEMNTRIQDLEHAQRVLTTTDKNAALDAYSTGGVKAMQLSPAFLRLPAHEQTELRDYTIRRGEMLAGVDEARRNRALREQERLAFPAYYDLSNDPDRLSAMSRDEVKSLLPRLGPSLSERLMNDWEKLHKTPEAIREGKIDSDKFNTVAADFGLPAFKTKKSDDDKELLGRLKDAVETRISAAQASRNAPLSPAEKEDLMRKAMAENVIKGGWFSRDKQVPISILTTKQLSDVRVPPEQEAIVEQKRKDMLARAQKEGRDTTPWKNTEENRVRIYIDMTDPSAAARLYANQR